MHKILELLLLFGVLRKSSSEPSSIAIGGVRHLPDSLLAGVHAKEQELLLLGAHIGLEFRPLEPNSGGLKDGISAGFDALELVGKTPRLARELLAQSSGSLIPTRAGNARALDLRHRQFDGLEFRRQPLYLSLQTVMAGKQHFVPPLAFSETLAQVLLLDRR